MTTPPPVLPLDRLAQACLAGDAAAWKELQHLLAPALARAVRRQLRRYRRRDRNPLEVEDLLQELWLRLYDGPRRGTGVLRRLVGKAKPLQTALEEYARELTDNAVRSARDRRAQEAAVARPLQAHDLDAWLGLTTEELLARLSPAAQAELRARLGLGDGREGSPDAVRQRCSRLRRRVIELLGIL